MSEGANPAKTRGQARRRGPASPPSRARRRGVDHPPRSDPDLSGATFARPREGTPRDGAQGRVAAGRRRGDEGLTRPSFAALGEGSRAARRPRTSSSRGSQRAPKALTDLPEQPRRRGRSPAERRGRSPKSPGDGVERRGACAGRHRVRLSNRWCINTSRDIYASLGENFDVTRGKCTC